MLEEIKSVLRVDGNELDGEIQSLIDAAVADLILSGVAADKAQNMTDPLIKLAIINYCRASFDYNDRSADRLMVSYEMLKARLALAEDYNSYAVIFNVVTSAGIPVRDAKITAGEVEKLTNSRGVAIFTVATPDIDLDYIVTKTGYQDQAGSVYVDGSKSIEVVLNEL